MKFYQYFTERIYQNLAESHRYKSLFSMQPYMNVCCTQWYHKTNDPNSVGPDPTAIEGAFRSGSSLFVIQSTCLEH